jgi:hypothetical protein
MVFPYASSEICVGRPVRSGVVVFVVAEVVVAVLVAEVVVLVSVDPPEPPASVTPDALATSPASFTPASPDPAAPVAVSA